jgi:ribosomal protein S18 acetylase RimI-like enzyme
MPGLLNPPNQSATITVFLHNSATDFLSAVHPELCSQQHSSGIIFAHALKRLNIEAGNRISSQTDLSDWLQSHRSSGVSHRESGSFWLSVWSYHNPAGKPTLDLVLSCLNWTLGNYPIFLWSPVGAETIETAWLLPRITQLAGKLLSCVPPERVFTVFGMTPLVRAFARCWSEFTGFQVEKEPVYAAYLSYCTPTTFINSESRIPAGHQIRQANISDLEPVAQLCKEFADESVYFPLTLQRGRIEARELIENGQVWVYNVNDGCSTICAVARSTPQVSTITKVYTTPKFRKMGCAECLIRYVTRELLFEDKKASVALYVGHQNNAQRVYDRVGFAGLCGKDKPEGVEDSLELGFIGANKGHW